MLHQESDIIIIGAGLTGLTLAYLLEETQLSVTILEGRPRIGGRIHTLYPEGEPPQEMGATWLGMKHQNLISLLEELNLETFPQELGDKAIYEPMSINPPQLVVLPANQDPSYRIKGGSSALINSLADRLSKTQLKTQQVVKSIKQKDGKVNVTTGTDQYTANKVISTLPPYLLCHTIDMQPQLPSELTHLASQTHTWMGESIKVSLAYERPFWKAENSSGTIFSNVGPVPEMYDHSDLDKRYFALMGFMNGNYHTLTRTERREMILKQLTKYYGTQASTPVAYHETVWREKA